MRNNYTPAFNEGAGTLHDTLLNSSGTKCLNLLTNAIRAIYDTGFNIDTFIEHTGESHFTIQRIQNWYLLQKLSHGYGRLHSLEATRLEESSKVEVQKKQQISQWRVSTPAQSLIESFQHDIHYGLKNFVEILARAVVEEKIKATGVYKSVKVYLTSDADDVLAGIDLIAECVDLGNKQHCIGIDVAVSENLGYLDQKSGNTVCKPLEFLYRRNIRKNNDIGMPRVVFAMSPEGMSGAIVASMNAFKNGNSVTPKLISNAYTEGVIGSISFGVTNLLQTISTH